MSEQRWWRQKNGKVTGPFTFAELQEGAAAGVLDPDDLVCPEGEAGKWVPAGTVPELFPQWRLAAAHGRRVGRWPAWISVALLALYVAANNPRKFSDADFWLGWFCFGVFMGPAGYWVGYAFGAVVGRFAEKLDVAKAVTTTATVAFFVLCLGMAAVYLPWERKQEQRASATPPPKADSEGARKTVPEVPGGAAYGPADVAFVRTELGRHKVGQVMLHCTHPSGVFGSASEPTLALGSDGRSLTGQVVVKWAGASGAPYQTTYSYTLGRGAARLRISADTAFFKSKMLNVKQAEQELARINGEIHRALADQNKLRQDIDKALRRTASVLADGYLLDGKYDLAVEQLDKMLERHPEDSLALNRRGFAHAKKGDFARAFADLDESKRLDPDSAGTYRLRGRVRVTQGDYWAAVIEYTESIRLDPKADCPFPVGPSKFSTHFERGCSYHKLGQFDQAINDLTEEIRAYPANVVAYELRAEAHERNGDAAAAGADRSKVAELKAQLPK